MKKSILIVLTLALVVAAFAGCGSSVDYSKLTEANQQLAERYNELAPIMVENGWEADEQTTTEFNMIAATIEACNETITTKDSTQEVVDDLTNTVNDMVAEMDNIEQKVSVVYGG